MSWEFILKTNPFLVSGRRKDTRCPTPTKIKYQNKAEAVKASKEHGGRNMRAYECSSKKHWHLTSEENFDYYGEPR